MVISTAVIVVVPISALAEAESYDWKSWGSVTDTLRTSDRGERITLSSSFIMAGSERVHVDGVTLSPDQYEINYQRGLLRIITPTREGAVVWVAYTRLPFLLSSVYSLRHIEFADPPDVVPQRVPQARPREQLINPTGDLVFGGMKSISLSVGTNRSSSLDQSLTATVEGNLTSTIKVRALLSDNNLPIQPEGNTEELEYLDKVFIEFTGPHGNATLGDFSYHNQYSDFSVFRRELKGVSAGVSGFDSKIGVAGGSSKGVFRSLEFRGTEQKQGPYDLLTRGRLDGNVIIAGTERVYFDGEILQRGRNRDYTIDYDSGTISFTPRRMVTADTEIGVHFEVTQAHYDRTFTFATVESGKLPGGFRFQTFVGRERDDSDRPKSVTLVDADRMILQEAGDKQDLAIGEGAVFVGVGSGDYSMVPGDTLVGTLAHFVFDDSTGAYLLSFTEVGAGNGDYVLDGITAKGKPMYRFAGSSAGNFIIGKRLPIPQSQGMITTRLVRKGLGRFDVDFEHNVSDFDGNVLSTLDNEDNIGDAGQLSLRLRELPVGVGELDFASSLSTIHENYKSFGQTRPWYFYTDWNLEGIPIRGRELLQETTATFRRDQHLKLDYSTGYIRRDDFAGIKQEARANLGSGDDRKLSSRVFTTAIDGSQQERTRKHGTASLAYGLWVLRPSLAYSSDEFLATSSVLPDSGFAYELYTVAVGKRDVKRYGYSFEASERRTEQLADTTKGWLDTRNDRTYRVSAVATGNSAVVGALEYSHRIQNDRAIGDKRTSDLARVHGVLRLNRLRFRTSFDYEISQEVFRAVDKTVVFVGEGKGDYNQLGEAVGEGRGDYTLVFLPNLETIPTRNVGLALRTSWGSLGSPHTARGSGLISWVKSNVSLEQQFAVREATTFAEGYKVYLLFPSALQRNESTIHGVVSLQQDWSLLNAYPNLSLNFRYQRDDEEDNRFGAVKEDSFFQQQILTLNRSISRFLSANVEAKREKRRRGGRGLPSGTGSTYDVNGWALAGGCGVRFSSGSTIDGQVEYSRRLDDESGAIERAWAFRPRFLWRLRKSLNLFGRYEFVYFSGEDNNSVSPFFFTDSGSSQRWSSTLNVKVSKIISFLTTYQGRSEDTFAGKRITEHDFKIETRAFF
ncbi:MAG: hypothetical protein OEN01_11065 [Candidatus Krumholzibacteria bacterium]|nr:hypothetical protein [Candidatus Krumholzibacteria bacterium]